MTRIPVPASGSIAPQVSDVPKGVIAEIELKLDVAPRCAARVLKHPALKGRAQGRWARTHVLTIYYDTPKFDLWRAQVSIRLRRTSAGWMQTVKWAGDALGGLHRRKELEQVVPEQTLALDGIADQPGLEALANERLRHGLKPIFVTEFERATRMLALADAGSIEASLDRGRIVCGTAVYPICELELELKSGTLPALFDIADAMLKDLPLRPACRSKAERGYLLAGLKAAPVKAKRLELMPPCAIGEAATSVIASGLAQMQANEDGMLAAKDIEYLHQMRVGVRRLRSCVSAFGRALHDGDLDALKIDLKWFGARLGAARDWDVFRAESLPLLQRGLAEICDPAALDALAQAAESAADAAGRSTRAAVRSKRACQLLLALGRAAAGGGFIATNEGLRQPMLPYSTALLGRRFERVLRLGKKTRGDATVAKLHELRIAVKKLRYAVEFFGSLYTEGRHERFRERLVKLQDCLGRICDAAAMIERVREAVPDHPSLIDCVRGWSAGIVYAERRHFESLWRQFRRSQRFW